MLVQRHDVRIAREGADQHHQGAFGQMKVGQQQVHHPKLEARCDENVGVAASVAKMRLRLQRPHGGGAHGYHAPAARAAIGDSLQGGGRHLEALEMHHVLANNLGFDRLKGAGAHMQRDAGLGHAASRQTRQHGLIKVQGSGRCGHGAGVFGKDSLVARLVLGRVGMRDVRRQRHMAVRSHQRIRVGAQGKVVERAVGVRPAPDQCGGEAAVHLQDRARQRLFADLHVRCHFQPLTALQHPLDQQLEPPAAGFLTIQPGLDHLGVVEHQQVAGLEQVGQLSKAPVGGRGLPAVQQARAAALGGRVLGDQFGGQVKVKISQRENALSLRGRRQCHVLEGRTGPFQVEGKRKRAAILARQRPPAAKAQSAHARRPAPSAPRPQAQAGGKIAGAKTARQTGPVAPD